MTASFARFSGHFRGKRALGDDEKGFLNISFFNQFLVHPLNHELQERRRKQLAVNLADDDPPPPPLRLTAWSPRRRAGPRRGERERRGAANDV